MNHRESTPIVTQEMLSFINQRDYYTLDRGETSYYRKSRNVVVGASFLNNLMTNHPTKLLSDGSCLELYCGDKVP
jgi:hypothetical protein